MNEQIIRFLRQRNVYFTNKTNLLNVKYNFINQSLLFLFMLYLKFNFLIY